MSKTLTIGCKLPSGLRMELGKPHDSNFKVVTLKGANSGEYTGRAENGRIFIPKTEQGYGLTQVDADFWEAWKKAYRINAERWLKEGVLFVGESPEHAKAEAIEKASVVTGFEQINPDKMPEGLIQRPAGE